MARIHVATPLGWTVRRSWLPALGCVLVAGFAPLGAQQWNSAPALSLVGRAVARRLEAQGDSTLRSYKTTAHGFVFFLAQVGEGLTEPPRLVKADELDVEVYWRAPNLSKQIILGWRDGRWLPTDINYHRDHLGIVTNNFGNRIRIGEGDEVRDVVHPLSPEGLERYDFALGESFSLRGERGDVRVFEVQVRPRSYREPLVVGSMYLDVGSAELVRFRFSFTPVSYLDPQLEDISVILENSLFEGRFWLPYRQEIEIRRRAKWFDFPARGIIRGRWEIGDYEFNSDFPVFALPGPAIGGLLQPAESGHPWSQPLDQAIGEVAAPLNRQDMDVVRAEVERIAGAQVLNGLPARRIGARSLSELVHVNRIQGLALGFGGVLGFGRRRIEVRPSVGYGTSDERVTGELSLTIGGGATQVVAEGGRRIQDLSDLGVISPLLNSLSSQEAGADHGDYLLREFGELGLRRRLGAHASVTAGVAVERPRSVEVAATPVTGSYRANPALGAGTYHLARLGVERTTAGIGARRALQGALRLEAGDGPTTYGRAVLMTRWEFPLGPGQLVQRGYLGWGTAGLPVYRSYVLGGRGTLLGEPFRAYGGRTMALTQFEWRVAVPFPAIPLGAFASTGTTITLAPFLAAGWSKRPFSGTPWQATAGIRPVAGVAAEWFMRLIRVEAGVGLRTGDFGLTVDINREWWGIL